MINILGPDPAECVVSNAHGKALLQQSVKYVQGPEITLSYSPTTETAAPRGSDR